MATNRENKFSIIGNSSAIHNTLENAEKISKTDFPLFLFGESGVGKSHFAKFIHKNSPRNKKPFIIIDCATIPETMAEVELFGHKKGAFTDAKEKRTGKFEAANGGTVFLDEIGDLSVSVQTKLLRVLQDKELVRIGENNAIKIDFRIIAATNRNIPKLIEEGKFREDLFYRFNTLPLEIPPLRNRIDDIPELAKYILINNSSRKYYFHTKSLELLKKHLYRKNNIRELENIIKFAITMAGDDFCIRPEHLNFQRYSCQEREFPEDVIKSRKNLNISQNVSPIINPIIKSLVREAMARHNQVKAYAAEELGISIFHLKKILNDSYLSFQEYLQFGKSEKEKENENKVDKIQKPIENYQEQQPLDELDSKSKTLVEIAQEKGWVTNNMVRDKMKISCSSAQRLLSSLLTLRIDIYSLK